MIETKWFFIGCVSMLLGGCSDLFFDGPPESVPEASVGTIEDEPDSAESQIGQPTDNESKKLSPAEVKLTKVTWDELMEVVQGHAGKIVVLDLWSTSCQPCLKEFPNLVNLSQKYPNEVVCLSCSTDYVGISSKPPEYYEERLRNFLSTQNSMFDNYLCVEPADEVFLKIDLASIPAVYVFGKDGELVERFDNDEQKYGDEFTYQEHIVPQIESLLKAAE